MQGSAYYNSSYNFMYLSGNGMKSDYGGHDNHHHHNTYAYVGKGFSICNQLKGFPDEFYSNCVIQNSDGNYGDGQACTTTSSVDATVVYNNTIYTPQGKVTECGQTLQAYQASGGDPGTQALTTPTDDELIRIARITLGL